MSCPFYKLGRILADRMHTKAKDLSIYIDKYNEWVKSNNKENTIISDQDYNNAENKDALLESYEKRLRYYMQHVMRIQALQESADLDELREAIGSNAAYSQFIVLNAFDTEQRESFRNELVYLLRKLASTAEYEDVRELLTNERLKDVYSYIKDKYVKARILLKNMPETDERFDIKDDLIRECDNIITFLPDLITFNLAEFKKIFGKTFNPESGVFRNLDDSDVANTPEVEDYDDEENTREHWSVVLDSIDPSGSLSYIINGIISLIPATHYSAIKDEEGNYKSHYEVNRTTNILRFKADSSLEGGKIPLSVDPRIEARKLMRLLGAATSVKDMMARLGNSGDKYQALIDRLNSDPRLKTTFFSAFNKYYVNYYFTSYGNEGLVEKFLNASGKSHKVSSFLYRLKVTPGEAATTNSIFFVERNKKRQFGFNPQKITEFAKFFKEQISSDADSFDIFKGKNLAQKKATLENIFNYLNIYSNTDTANLVLCDDATTYRFLSEVNTLIKNLLTRKATTLSGYDEVKRFFSVKGEDAFANSAMSNILETVDLSNEGSVGFSGMVSYNGGKQTANIQMSKFTSFIKKINHLIPQDILDYIQNVYSKSACYFDADNNRYLVRWLEDIIKSCTQSSRNTLRRRLAMVRNLGFEDCGFDEISDKGHMMSMLSMYFNRLTRGNVSYIKDPNHRIENIDIAKGETLAKILVELNGGNKLTGNTFYIVEGGLNAYRTNADASRIDISDRSDYCTIPTFTTGDTLALRGITSLHYSFDEIADGIYDFLDMDYMWNNVAEFFHNAGLAVGENGKETFTSKKNLGKFGHCKFLNPNYVAHVKRGDEWVAVKGYWSDLYNSIGAKSASKETVVNQIIKPYLKESANYFIEKSLPSLNIDPDTYELINSSKLSSYGKTAEKKLVDFYVNYRFSQMNQLAIMDGTPNFFRNTETVQKRNKGNYTNGEQLVADAIDPVTGEYVWGDTINPTQRVGYIYDVLPLLSAHDRMMLEKIGLSSKTEDYNSDSSLTDGQAWRSFESWRKIGLSFGKNVWTDEMETNYWEILRISKEIYALEDALAELEKANVSKDDHKVTSIENKLLSKQQEAEDLATVYQPRKPINDGLETYNNIVLPFQHKYAEIPIIPALHPRNSGLRALGRFMESSQLDMILSSKCGKKGVFGEADVQYLVNENGQYVDNEGEVIKGYDSYGKEISNPTRAEQRRNENFKKLAVQNSTLSIDEMLRRQFHLNDETGVAENVYSDRVTSAVVHESSLLSYLIQTNVPDHVNHETLLGTQLKKIILGGINQESSYSYNIGGKPIDLSGTELIKLYNAAVSLGYMNSFAKFSKVLLDEDRLIKDLAATIISNDRCDLNTIDKITRGMPLWDSSIKDEAFSTLISMFKKNVIKQKVEGGSIVQASALGSGVTMQYLNEDLEFHTDENGMPIYAEAVIPFNFHYTNTNGSKVTLEYSKYCNFDGTFKVNKETGNTLIEEQFPGILDMIIYRIPSERDYSCVRIKVKRCCPATGANYIQLPTIITKRMGCDFDIDKAVVFRRAFDATANEYHVKKVWDAIFSEREDLAEPLRELKDSGSYTWEEELEDGGTIRRTYEITPEDIASINDTYLEKGLDVPKKEDIPINKFWDIAVREGIITEDKDEVFSEMAESNSSFLKGVKFANADITNSEGKLDLHKLFSSSKSQIDNILLDIMLNRLADPETFSAQFTFGGFDDTKLDAKFVNIIKTLSSEIHTEKEGVREISLSDMDTRDKVDSLPDPNIDYDFSEPMTAVIYNKLNQAAAKLIGVYANDSSNYFIFSKIKSMRLSKKAKPIIFGNALTHSDEIDGTNMLVRHSLGKDTSQKLAELLAAAVDAVKDPVLNFLNLNEVTAEAATVLVRMGYDTTDVGLLFNQPIIAETCTLMRQDGISSFKVALNIILEKHGMKKLKDLKKGGVQTKYLTREALAYNLTNGATRDNTYYQKSQAEVAKVMFNLLQIKDEFSKIVQLTRNTSSNVVKSDISEYFSREERIKDYLDSKSKLISIEINDVKDAVVKTVDQSMFTAKQKEEYFEAFKDHPFAFENIVYNIINKAMKSIIDNYTPFAQQTFSSVIEEAKKLCAYGTLSSDSFNQIFEDTHKVLLRHLNGDFNPTAIDRSEYGRRVNPEGIPNAEFYLKHIDEFIERIANDKDENGMPSPAAEQFDDTFLFNSSVMDVKDVKITEIVEGKPVQKTYHQYVLKPNYNLTKNQKIDISSSWMKLYDSDNQLLQDVAKAIMLHLYYSNGLQNTTEFSLTFVPSIVFENCIAEYGVGTEAPLTYTDFMNGLVIEGDALSDSHRAVESTGLSAGEILAEVVRMNLDNKQFVYHTNKSTSDMFTPLDNTDSIITVKDSALDLVTHSRGEEKHAVPYIIKEGMLYELEKYKGGKGGTQISKADKSLNYIAVTTSIDDSVAQFIFKGDDKGGKKKNSNYVFGQHNIAESFASGEYFAGEDDTNDEPNTPTEDFAVAQTSSKQEAKKNNTCME